MAVTARDTLLARARALLAAATPGPWQANIANGTVWAPSQTPGWREPHRVAAWTSESDAALIAAAPELIAALVEECERLEARVRELKEDLLWDLEEYDRDQHLIQAGADRIAELEAERDRLRAALQRYGRHLPPRGYGHACGDGQGCVCGLDVALGGGER